jgi:hypothetical protein
MSETAQNNEIYTWYEGWDYKYKKQKGIPRTILTLVIDAPQDYSGRKWTLYGAFAGTPPTGGYALPESLYLEVSGGIRNVFFDFLCSSNQVMVVSENMLCFLKEHGLTDGYEIAEIADVINKSGKSLEPNKKYFALRFYDFDDEMIDFGNEVEVEGGSQFKTKFTLYPNMRIKDGVNKEIFALSKFFFNSLFFSDRIRQALKEKKFICPPMYAMSEFHKAFTE